MGWYKDKLDASTVKLALAGAGAGAKALSRVAKIPLDIAQRELQEFDADTKRMSAMTPERVAQINALAKTKAAELGYKGKDLTAKAKMLSTKMQGMAKMYVADAGVQGKKISAVARDNATSAYRGRTKVQRDNNIDDNFTQQITSTDKNYTQREVAKTNAKAKSTPKKVLPKITLKLDDQGKIVDQTIVKPYKKEASGDDWLIEMEKKAKKRKAR